jgi:hypothetical protein
LGNHFWQGNFLSVLLFVGYESVSLAAGGIRDFLLGFGFGGLLIFLDDFKVAVIFCFNIHKDFD